MRRMAIIFSLFLLALMFGCSDHKSPAEAYDSPFQGGWSIVFAGDYVGSGTMTINSDGSFSVPVYLTDQYGNQFTNTVSGDVSDSGWVYGHIYLTGTDIGDITGNLSSSDLEGAGTYIAQGQSSGTWAAHKN